MRSRAFSFVAIALAAAACGLPLACGSSPEGGGDPSTSGGGQEARGATPLGETASTSSRPRLFHGAAILAKSKGEGFAGFSVCSTGEACSGKNAGTEFYAQFTPDSEADAGSTCTTRGDGACSITTCAAGSGAAPPGVSAGVLTIGGGTLGSVAVKATKKDDFQYLFEQAGAGFSGGDSLTLAGSGGTVAAFSTQTLVAPDPITLTSPSASAKGAYKIPTASPLKLEWTGGTKGATVVVQGDASYSETEDGGSSVLVQSYFVCGWDASAGKGTVPTSMLAPLAGAKGDLYWAQESASLFTAGSYQVEYYIDTLGGAPASFE